MEELPNVFWVVIILFVFFIFTFIIYNPPPPPINTTHSTLLSPTTQKELNNPEQKSLENIPQSSGTFYTPEEVKSNLKKTIENNK